MSFLCTKGISMKRFWLFQDVPDELWRNWRWQFKNRLRNSSDILRFFPNLPGPEILAFQNYIQRYNISLTPYVLSLINTDERDNPVQDDPVWNQFRFLSPDEMTGCDDYDGVNINWESPSELPTRLLQHKYPDRAIIRIINQCFGHCNYCYLTSRVLDREALRDREDYRTAWLRTLEYLKARPQIRDVLISGGEPLMLSNERLKSLLSDLSDIPSLQTIRLNTRAFTFNPYRIDRELVEIFKKYRLTALELHIAHPREMNDSMDQVLQMFDDAGYRPVMLWRSPLLKGINNSVEILEELFFKLYSRRILPYYIFHYAPYTLGRSRFGLSIREGCELLAALRRCIPGPAFPKYTLFHVEGKQDIPLELEGTPTFQYIRDESGRPAVRFKNWKGHWVTYPDLPYEKTIESTSRNAIGLG